MHLRMLFSIFRKDVRDAIRDARVLIAILVPIGLGFFYGQLFDDTPPRPSATVVYASAEPTTLPDMLREVAGGDVDLKIRQEPDAAAVRQVVEAEDADIGLVIPPGFDAAVRGGASPALTVIQRASPGFGSNYVMAALDGALRAMAGQQPPATIQTDVISEPSGSQAIFEQLGLRRYFVLVSAVFLIAMIALLVVPVILAEEAEKKTLEALVMVASYPDVIGAKALVGIVYVVVSVALLLALTGLSPANAPLFAVGILLLSVALIGFGLLLGGLVRNANQLNTWSGVLLMPVIAPAFLVGLDLPRSIQIVLQFFPTSQATQILINGLSGQAVFEHAWLSFLVIVVWGAAGYGLLLRSLRYREA